MEVAFPLDGRFVVPSLSLPLDTPWGPAIVMPTYVHMFYHMHTLGEYSGLVYQVDAQRFYAHSYDPLFTGLVSVRMGVGYPDVAPTPLTDSEIDIGYLHYVYQVLSKILARIAMDSTLRSRWMPKAPVFTLCSGEQAAMVALFRRLYGSKPHASVPGTLAYKVHTDQYLTNYEASTFYQGCLLLPDIATGHPIQPIGSRYDMVLYPPMLPTFPTRHPTWYYAWCSQSHGRRKLVEVVVSPLTMPMDGLLPFVDRYLDHPGTVNGIDR